MRLDQRSIQHVRLKQIVQLRGESIPTIKDHLLREPERSYRHLLTALSGCVLIALGLLYATLPQTLQASLVGLGALNILLGVSEYVPRDRVRLAGALRITAYLLFFCMLALAVVVFLTASD